MSAMYTVGNQIAEVLVRHRRCSKSEARRASIATMRDVGIPDPEQRFDAYTFELSGGLRQRAMIAQALVCEPRLLIADEPTTALDVTTQAVILDLLRELQRQRGMSMLFITHDLGVVAQVADRVVILYLGQVVEHGPADRVLTDPQHPYTAGAPGFRAKRDRRPAPAGDSGGCSEPRGAFRRLPLCAPLHTGNRRIVRGRRTARCRTRPRPVRELSSARCTGCGCTDHRCAGAGVAEARGSRGAAIAVGTPPGDRLPGPCGPAESHRAHRAGGKRGELRSVDG